MNNSLMELSVLLPEIVLASGICVLLIVDLFVRDSARDFSYLLAIFLLAGVAWVLIGTSSGERGTDCARAVHMSPMDWLRVLKLFAVTAVATVFLYSRPYLRSRKLHFGEYYVLGLFGLLGIMVLASGYSLLVSYLGLEILSLSLYAMVAFDRDSARSAEAAMKYFVLGAIASGTLLYGMSLVYGITGTLQIAELQTTIAAQSEVVGLWVGLGFMVAGVAFKFGAVPFHMWVPDVYDGAPTSVTLYIGTAPKLGALALAVRLLVEGAAGLASFWEPMLAALAVCRWCSATSRRSRRQISGACWRIRRFRMSASSCWAWLPAVRAVSRPRCSIHDRVCDHGRRRFRFPRDARQPRSGRE